MPTGKVNRLKKTTKTTLGLNAPNRTLPEEVPEMEGQPPSDGHGNNGEQQDDGRSISQGTSEEITEINEQKDNSIPEVPTVQANFIISLVKFGVKPASAKAITDYIVATGSPLVFEDPLELLAKMTKFPFQVPALIRRQVLDYWIAINKIELPDDYEKQVNRIDKTDKDSGGNDGEAQVQILGGKVVPTDKPMSPAQAEKVMATIEAMGGKGGGKESDEAKFTFDENGELQILPGAKLTVVDAMLIGTIRKKQAAGDTRDPLEILADSMGKVESVKAALGVQQGGGGNPLSTPEGIKSMKEVFGGDEATRVMITNIQENFNKSQDNIVKLIEKMGEKPKEDPQVAEMKAKLDELNKRLEDEREERHKLESDQLKTQIDSLRTEIKGVATGQQSKNEYGIMDKGLDKLGEAGNKFLDKFGEIITRGANPNLIPSKTAQEKTALTTALSNEAKKATEASKIGKQVFGNPLAPPVQPPTPVYPPTIPDLG